MPTDRSMPATFDRTDLRLLLLLGAFACGVGGLFQLNEVVETEEKLIPGVLAVLLFAASTVLVSLLWRRRVVVVAESGITLLWGNRSTQYPLDTIEGYWVEQGEKGKPITYLWIKTREKILTFDPDDFEDFQAFCKTITRHFSELDAAQSDTLPQKVDWLQKVFLIIVGTVFLLGAFSFFTQNSVAIRDSVEYLDITLAYKLSVRKVKGRGSGRYLRLMSQQHPNHEFQVTDVFLKALDTRALFRSARRDSTISVGVSSYWIDRLNDPKAQRKRPLTEPLSEVPVYQIRINEREFIKAQALEAAEDDQRWVGWIFLGLAGFCFYPVVTSRLI